MKSSQPLWFMIILWMMVLAVACSPLVSSPSAPQGSPQVQQPAAPTAVIPAQAVETARQAIAQQLGVPPEQLEVFSVEERQFPNSCLGLPQEGEACAEVIISGYQGVLLGEGVQYEFRVSEDGVLVRFLPGAALSAQQLLAAQLGISPEEVGILSFESVEWPDACLGIATPGLMCAQVITPGFRVILESQGKRYEFHTDLSGSDVRLALPTKAESGDAILEWQGEEGGVCQKVLLYEDLLSFGVCDQSLTSVPLVGRERRQEVKWFTQQYAPFDVQISSGTLIFRGQGSVTATSTEQRMLAEWARQLWQEHDPQARSTSSLAIAFHREGGIAGFCEDVLIYRSGIAEISSCRPAQQLGVEKIYLTAGQMQELYRWLDTFLPFESSEGDSGAADGMTLRIVFNGKGKKEADADERQYISRFAQEIADQALQVQDSAALEAARQVLLAYLDALKKADYQAVVELYGGSYAWLAEMNPDLPAEDRLALWTRACQQNGFVCNLTVKNWVQVAQLSPDQFRFTVELQNPDGSLFVLGPCCGADVEEFPPLTQFDFLVQHVGDAFLVQSLPIYVP